MSYLKINKNELSTIKNNLDECYYKIDNSINNIKNNVLTDNISNNIKNCTLLEKLKSVIDDISNVTSLIDEYSNIDFSIHEQRIKDLSNDILLINEDEFNDVESKNIEVSENEEVQENEEDNSNVNIEPTSEEITIDNKDESKELIIEEEIKDDDSNVNPFEEINKDQNESISTDDLFAKIKMLDKNQGSANEEIPIENKDESKELIIEEEVKDDDSNINPFEEINKDQNESISTDDLFAKIKWLDENGGASYRFNNIENSDTIVTEDTDVDTNVDYYDENARYIDLDDANYFSSDYLNKDDKKSIIEHIRYFFTDRFALGKNKTNNSNGKNGD